MRASALLLALGSSSGACAPAASPPACELRYEVDAARVRAVGWAAAGADDRTAWDAARARVLRRLRAFDLGLGVREELPGRLVVGPLDHLTARDRDRLDAHLRDLGRVELFLLAEERDLGHPGSTGRLEAGAEAAMRWREAHAGEPLAAYGDVAVVEGGPDPRLLWLEDEEGGLHAALLPDRPSACVGASDLSAVLEVSWGRPLHDSPPSMLLQPSDEGTAWDEFVARAEGRTLVLLVDGRSSEHTPDRTYGSNLALGSVPRARLEATRRALGSRGPLVGD